MKIQELVILGLLNQHPRHGYQIKKFLKQVLALYTDIPTKSVYYSLKTLEKQGMVEKRVGREGQRPEKYVYSITGKGRRHSQELLIKNISFLSRPFIAIDLSLYFLPAMDREAVKKSLRLRLRGLERVKRWLLRTRTADIGNKKHLTFIVEHNRELLEAEQRFTRKLLAGLESESSGEAHP